MASDRAYFDWNASAPLLAEARAAMLAAIEMAGNPSSVHAEGRAQRALVEAARREVAALVGAMPENVVFTSGASEAAAQALTPHWTMGRSAVKFSCLYLLATEHPCVLSGGRFGPDVCVLPVNGDAILDIAVLEQVLAAHDRAAGLPLVAVQAANGETGVIQPVAEIAAKVKAAGGVFVCDAAQAAGRIPLDLESSGADMLILSSHKLGGPKGAGALVSASSLLWPTPLVPGGGQERGHRSGTENVPAIAGFGAAARAAAEGLGGAGALRARRDGIEAALVRLAPDVVIHGAAAPRLANTIYVSIPGVKAETAQIGFDLAGVSVSAGSACSSGKVGPSHVLKAMGADAVHGAIRISFGPSTTDADVGKLLDAFARIVARRRTATRAVAAE